MSQTLTRRHIIAGGTAVGALGALGLGRASAQGQQDMVHIGWSQTEAGSKPFFDTLFARFQKANPDVKLETVGVPFGQFETTLFLRKRSNQRTDTAQMSDRMLAPFVAAGGIADVDQVFDRATTDKTFDETALGMTMVRGKRFGFPWATGTIGLVGNGKVLADAGARTDPQTIDEMLDVLRKVKKAKPSSSPLGISTKGPALAQFETQLLFWSYGARFFDGSGNVTIDSEPARQALSLLAEMVKEGLILPGNDRFDFRKLYAQELVAFYPDQPLVRSFAREMSGKGEAYDRYILPVAMPVPKKGDPSVAILGGHLLVFPEYGGAKPTPDGPAGRFMKLITDPTVQVDYYKATGLFPTVKEAIAALKDDAFFTRWIEVNRNARLDELAPFLNAGELRTIVGEEIIAAMLGQKPAAEALKTMASRLKAAVPKL
jgi:multiple sugar transport system substrate-binding protein